jgi:hypothetical protein
LFKTIDDLLGESIDSQTQEGIRLFRSSLSSQQLELICDQKEIGSDQFYRLNRTKMMNFLNQKLLAVAFEFLENDIDMEGTLFLCSFIYYLLLISLILSQEKMQLK